MKLADFPDWVQVKWDAALAENPNLIGILGPWEPVPQSEYTEYVRLVVFDSGNTQTGYVKSHAFERDIVDGHVSRSWLLLDEAP